MCPLGRSSKSSASNHNKENEEKVMIVELITQASFIKKRRDVEHQPEH